VRRAAIEQLAVLDDERVFPQIAEAVVDESPLIRAAAVCALARAGESDDADPLLGIALRDPDTWVRYFSIRALVNTGRAPMHHAQLARLASSDQAMQVRLAAIESLGYCGEEQLPVLLDLVHSPVSEVACAAVLALPRIDHPSVLSLLAELARSTDKLRRGYAVKALGLATSTPAVGVLRLLATGLDADLSTHAIVALGSVALPEAAEALVAAAAWPQRRDACIHSLVNLQDVAITALRTGLAQAPLDVRRTLVDALARIRTPWAMDLAEGALTDCEAAVRHSALTALAHIRPRHTAFGSHPMREGRP
jgi:HEAT repeat protein